MLLKEKAARALACLALNAQNKARIAEEGGIQPFVTLVREGTVSAKESAGQGLINLGRNKDTQADVPNAASAKTSHALACGRR